MSLRSLYICTLLLRFHPIFSPRALVASLNPGTLQFYDDYDCDHPSTISPTVTLSVSTCLVTTGGEGVVIAALPQCASGTATLVYYSDTACGVQASVSSSIFSKNCFQLADGTDLFNAKAVMFSCQPAANNPTPSSTTTAVVSALAAVATGSANSGGSGSSASTTGSTPSATGSQKNSAGSSNSNNNSNTNSNTNTNTNSGSGSGSGLGIGDIIALAVGLGIGIPTIIIMIAAWRFPVFREKLVNALPGHSDQSALNGNEPPPWHHSKPQQIYPPQPPYYNKPQEMKPWKQQHYSQPQEMDSQPQHYNQPQEMDAGQPPFRPY